jgi:DHA2 family lincomycin resistance protein-like MFS transporter
VAAMAMLVSPLVGRFSDRLSPRSFGVPALVVMAVGVYSLASLPPDADFWAACWRLCLVGLGVGATFPAVSIGSMGSIRGQELGLGSGIVNMARQVGFAIGVALFVAVFTGAVDGSGGEPGELRDAYGAAFKTGAFVILLAIPFSWTMRRKPSDVQAQPAAAAAG